MGLFDFLWMDEKTQKIYKDMSDGIKRMERGLYELQEKKERRRMEENRRRIEEEQRQKEDREAFLSKAEKIRLSIDGNSGSFIDERDGEKYKTIKIGEQIWLAENFRYKCDNSFSYEGCSNGAFFGRFYPYETLKSVCPAGWRIPYVEDFKVLFDCVGGAKDAARMLKSRTSWEKSSEICADAYGFNALASGYFFKDVFYDVGFSANFWTLTSENWERAYNMNLQLECPSAFLLDELKTMAFSVRLIKDNC